MKQMPKSSQDNQTPSSNRTLILRLLLIVVFMLGFGYALVPIYERICEVLGIKFDDEQTLVTTEQVVENPDKDRLITIDFIASKSSAMLFDFKATDHSMKVHPGKLYTTTFVAKNKSSKPVLALANYNALPISTANYIQKTACFCFNEQKFEAGEEKEMPVVFIIDPRLPKKYDRVTLSYSFARAEN